MQAVDELERLAERHGLTAEARRELAELIRRLADATFGFDSSIELPDPEEPVQAGLALPATAEGPVPGRYDDLGPIGAGGMGEVRRVRDRELGRTCAIKLIRAEFTSRPNVVARFVEEAQVAAQLQHPNIAPVYDAGRLTDGRLWFTMKEIHGRTLADVILELHASTPGGAPHPAATDWTLHRLVDAFAKVCDGVGYAHARGVVHRDLKPENVMVGAHGEVLVLDWGLAKVLGRLDPPFDGGHLEPEVASTRSADAAQQTRMGGVLGTAAYMPPEQARGEVDRLDPRSDVYALGAILYEILAGSPPYEGFDGREVLKQVIAGPPPAVTRRAPARVLPDELVELCEQCMARDPDTRPPDGAAVGAAARAWLDGARKREKALEIVAQADALVDAAKAQRLHAARLRGEGDALAAGVQPWEPEGAKAAGWEKQDQAERTERDAALVELRREALLRGALTHAPALAEAHSALAELEQARHAASEAARDDRGAARAAARLQEHADALPEGHETRRRAAAYLQGDGALTLVTDVPGVEVELHHYEVHNRRLVAVPVRSLGPTPLAAVPLARGSYLCVLRHPGRARVDYPIHIGRGEHWHGVAPDQGVPSPIHMPAQGTLGPEDRLVPAGWFWTGGDAEAVPGQALRRLWCDALVMKRFPVTNREYIAYLDDLVATGREAEALRHAPRERAAMGDGSLVYGRDPEGRFVLRADADGDVWDPDWPVTLVDWFGANAYAAWLAARTGQPWRLPAELEWEKAARGADGRLYPWGDGFDPSWCCMRGSHPGRALPAVVDSFPVDTSVYGVRGLGGNVQDWCQDVFRREGPAAAGDTRVSPELQASGTDTARVLRGGVWYGSARDARSAFRVRSEPGFRSEYLGFRVVMTPHSASTVAAASAAGD